MDGNENNNNNKMTETIITDIIFHDRTLNFSTLSSVRVRKFI